jgi:hypothetical protein
VCSTTYRCTLTEKEIMAAGACVPQPRVNFAGLVDLDDELRRGRPDTEDEPAASVSSSKAAAMAASRPAMTC